MYMYAKYIDFTYVPLLFQLELFRLCGKVLHHFLCILVFEK
jgi:hypothetical protein